MSLNLAKRPFVNTRPANAVAAFLAVVVIALSALSLRTVQRYLNDSEKTRAAIATLAKENARLDEERRLGENRLSRFNLGDLEDSALVANVLARKRAFSWTRLLTRLEEVLPTECRVMSISLAKMTKEPVKGSFLAPEEEVRIDLSLVSRDPDGLPRVLRAFYGSEYFDKPAPQQETGPDKGSPDGHQLRLSVVYKDKGAGRPEPAASTLITEEEPPKPKPARKGKAEKPAGQGAAAVNAAKSPLEPTKVARGASVITKSPAATPPEPRVKTKPEARR